MKRVLLFLATNVAVIATVSVVLSLLGIGGYLDPEGQLVLGRLALFCLIWGMAGSFISLQLSRWVAKWATGVDLVDGQSGDDKLDWLYDTVARLARRAHLPMPEVGIYPSSEVNAFATGPSKKRSLVAVSTGMFESMPRPEIRAVLAHELSHIKNGDMVTMALIQGVINAFVMFVARIIAWVVSSAVRSEKGGYGLYLLVVFLCEIVFGFLGTMVTAWFSRRREFRADAGAAELASGPKMVAALTRLMTTEELVDASHKSLMAFKIAGRSRWLSVFSTHPPLAARIAALEARSG